MSHLAPLMKLSCLSGGSHGVSDTPYVKPRTTQPTVELAKGGGKSMRLMWAKLARQGSREGWCQAMSS